MVGLHGHFAAIPDQYLSNFPTSYNLNYRLPTETGSVDLFKECFIFSPLNDSRHTEDEVGPRYRSTVEGVPNSSYATTLKRSGISSAVIFEVLCHSGEATTKAYLDKFEQTEINSTFKHPV